MKDTHHFKERKEEAIEPEANYSEHGRMDEQDQMWSF